MGLNELSGVLWRERRLLELLQFKLEEQQLIVADGRTRWIGHATREIEQVLDQVRATELGRAVEAEQAARELGLEEGCSLRALAAAAPVPWDELLQEHHAALLTLVEDLAGVAVGNRDLLAASADATRATLHSLQDALETR